MGLDDLSNHGFKTFSTWDLSFSPCGCSGSPLLIFLPPSFIHAFTSLVACKLTLCTKAHSTLIRALVVLLRNTKEGFHSPGMGLNKHTYILSFPAPLRALYLLTVPVEGLLALSISACGGFFRAVMHLQAFPRLL